jgi:hypothetical protein
VAPTTTLKLMVYHRHSWKVAALVAREAHGAWWRLDKAVAKQSEAQTGCPVTYSYSRRGFAALLARHGFAVEEMFVDHIFPFRVKEYVEYRYVKAFPFNILPEPVTRALERRFGWHLCVTGRPANPATRA